MLTIYFINFCKSIVIVSFVIFFSSPLFTHPSIAPAPTCQESYAVSYMREDMHEPILTRTSRKNPLILSASIRWLTVTSNAGYFGNFFYPALEDEDYRIFFDKKHKVVWLVKSRGKEHSVCTPLLYIDAF